MRHKNKQLKTDAPYHINKAATLLMLQMHSLLGLHVLRCPCAATMHTTTMLTIHAPNFSGSMQSVLRTKHPCMKGLHTSSVLHCGLHICMPIYHHSFCYVHNAINISMHICLCHTLQRGGRHCRSTTT